MPLSSRLAKVLACTMLIMPPQNGRAQDITFSYNNVSLKAVLKEIKEQSGFDFMYNDRVVGENIRVSIHANKLDVSEVLDRCLKNTDLTYSIKDKTVIITAAAKRKNGAEPTSNKAQNFTLTGTVKSKAGDPIAGATIKVLDNGTQALTDGLGNFQLRVDKQMVSLEISSVGYSTLHRNAVAGESIALILDERVNEMDEVVVVGYGTQKKIHVTGSVAQINSEELNRTPMSNVTNMLAGKLPGLISRQSSGLPGADAASLTIRGFGTFNDSSPLLLVDGVERAFNNLDPNDVESVTILKDAAASAIYGVRAAHGVILVKTRRGNTNDDVKISYTNGFSISNNTRFPKFLNGPDYAKWHNRARELDGATGYFSESDIDKIKNGDPDGLLGNTDWLDLLFKDHANMQQHNVSAYGGSAKSQFFVSAGFMDQQGIIPNTSFKRYNLRSNVDVNVSDNISLLLNVAGRKEDTDHPGFAVNPNNGYNPITQAIRVSPFIPSSYQGLPTATGPSASTWSPVAAANESGFYKTDRYVFESSMELAYKMPFLDGLSVKVFGNYDHNFTEQRNFLESFQVNKFNLATRNYTQTRADGTADLSSLFQGSSNGSMLTMRPSLQYQKEINKHSIGALLLYEYRETNGSSFQASRRNFLISDIPELSFAQEDVANSVRGSSNTTRIAGYVGRFNYAYSNKYLAEVAFRYDGSYKFHPDYRWGFFPSVSLGWVASEEAFFQSASIDRLKFRMSAGELGKDNLDAFLYRSFFALTDAPVYGFGENTAANYALYSTNSVPSSNLGWEKTRVANIGMEMNLWKGKLDIELDAFYKYTYDILQAVAGVYPPSISDNFRTIENSGKVSARGMELSLTHKSRVNNVFYQLKSNVSWARNKVLSRVQAENVPEWQSIIGKPIGGIYGFQSLGLYQTAEELENRPTGPGGVQRLGDLRYEDYNGDGKLDTYDLVRIANSTNPELMLGFSADISWKALSFGFQLQGAGNSDVLISGLYPNGVMDQTEFARAFYEGGNAPYYLVEGSWTPENTDAQFPRLGEVWNGNNGWTSSWWVYNGAYLRLKQAYLGVTIPKEWIRKAHIDNLRVNISGSNLLTWDYLKFLDPEMPNNNNGYYPQQRTFSLGLSLTF